MRRPVAAIALATLAIAGALPHALAYVKAGPPMAGPGHHRLKAAAAVAPPFDGLTTPLIGYSFRKARTAYAGNAARIRRASDNAELDIGFVGGVAGSGAPWDEAVAVAHCAATTCFIRLRYNQGSGGSTYDVGTATAANQPQVIFGCQNFLACLQWTTGTQSLLSAGSITPATGVATLAAVAKRVSGTGNCVLIRENAATGNRLVTQSATANAWNMIAGTGGSGNIPAPATDNAWHSGIAVFNGASSGLTIDGTTTTGTTTGNTAAGAVGMGGAASTTCQEVETFGWDNYPPTPVEIAALTANQRSFWNF